MHHASNVTQQHRIASENLDSHFLNVHVTITQINVLPSDDFNNVSIIVYLSAFHSCAHRFLFIFELIHLKIKNTCFSEPHVSRCKVLNTSISLGNINNFC